MEEDWLDIFRRTHLAAGLVALVVAPLAMLVRKGGDAHRRWGKLFVLATAVMVIASVVLGIAEQNALMPLVALFGFHMIATGYRSLYLKKLHEGQKPSRADLLVVGIAAVINAGLFLWALSLLMLGQKFNRVMLFLLFGGMGLVMVFFNFNRFYKRSHDKLEWLFGHISGMVGGYIATVAVFSSVTLDMINPPLLRWIWPALIGAPLIFYLIRYYKRRFSKGRRPKDVFRLKLR